MNRWRLSPLAALVLLTTACGPTLTRGANGWHETGLGYDIAPLDDGNPFPAGWALHGYTKLDDGFRREEDRIAFDFELDRREDDGVLLIKTCFLEEGDEAKLPDVLADRWLDRVVQNPKEGREARVYARALPPLTETATGSVGFHTVESTMVLGRNVQIERRHAFTAAGAEATEITASLSPHGSPADRRIYLVVAHVPSSARYVVFAYGNTPTMFDAGLADATSLAHRLRF